MKVNKGNKKRHTPNKLFTYVSANDIARLEAIKNKFGFNSTYQILQYLTYCFLRVADPDNDPIVECIPEEIENMFIPLSEFEHNKIHSRKKIIKTPDDIK